MEQIKLTGAQIVDTRKMKQSGRYRITLELTEEDTKFNGGALAVAEINDLLANVNLHFTEIQGQNNGYEKSVVKETSLKDLFKPLSQHIQDDTKIDKKPETVYQHFKRTCEAYSGIDYYKRLKKHLGVEHLKELQERFQPFDLGVILGKQDAYINDRILGFSHLEARKEIFKDDNYSKQWAQLFDSFNNPQA